MDSGPIFTLTSPAHVGQIHLGSALPVLDGIRRRKGNPEVVEKSGEATLYEEGVSSLLSKAKPTMPVQPLIGARPTDNPVAVTRTESLSNPNQHTSLNHQLKAGSIDSFLGLRAPSVSSTVSKSTGFTVLNEKFSGDTESHADLGTEVSKPQSQGGVSLWKQLLDFCWSLFYHDPSLPYLSFLRLYPEYKLTWPIDTLRKREYERLKQTNEVYMDYMGASLYPEGLVRSNSTFLCQAILGNTHSFSTSSHQSAMCAEEARSSVLAFFDAPPEEYTVVFTPNATGALRLVGEAFPFVQDSTFVLGADSHNSINGIRQFALNKGARLAYIASTSIGGMNESEAKTILMANSPRSRIGGPPGLFALTGLSNVTNSKNPLSLITYASDLGYSTLLDAAALAPSSKISLSDTPADAMAISFYKMFGFPTGVGCLVAKKSFLRQLKRPWFAGGTVDVVQVPGSGYTAAQQVHEQFEDGTINFASLAAVTRGLNMLSEHIAYLPLRLSALTRYLVESLGEIRHDASSTPVALILSRRPGRRLSAVGEQSDTGSTVSLVFLEPSGETMSNSFVEYAATKNKISLRTGCMCNPGGSAAILGFEAAMEKFSPGITYEDFEDIAGRELGVVRISLGLVSDFSDVHRLLHFVREVIARDDERKKVWSEWKLSKQCHHA